MAAYTSVPALDYIRGDIQTLVTFFVLVFVQQKFKRMF